MIRKEGFAQMWARVWKGKPRFRSVCWASSGKQRPAEAGDPTHCLWTSGNSSPKISQEVLQLEFIKKSLFCRPHRLFLLTFMASSFMKYLTLYQGTSSPFIVRRSPPQGWDLHELGMHTTDVQLVLKDKALLICPFPFNRQATISTLKFIFSFIFKNKVPLLSNVHLRIQQTNIRNCVCVQSLQ